MAERETESRCIELALDQHGVISSKQAVGLGLTNSAVQRRVQSQRWVPIHRGVYRLREVQPTWQQALMAACLWGGPTAAASHRAAARLLGLGIEHAPTEVTLGGLAKRAPRSVRLHRTDSLEPVDVLRVDGIPATTASRTLIDLGTVTSQVVVDHALESALRQGLTSIWHLIGRLDELGKPGRRGVGTIRNVLRDRDPRLVPTASQLESMLATLIRNSHLPSPERQFSVYDADGFIGRTDFAYPAHFLVLEAQSAAWHLQRDRWLSDMERRNRLMLLGWRVLEIPWRDIVQRPRKVVDRIDAALRAVVVGNRP